MKSLPSELSVRVSGYYGVYNVFYHVFRSGHLCVGVLVLFFLERLVWGCCWQFGGLCWFIVLVCFCCGRTYDQLYLNQRSRINISSTFNNSEPSRIFLPCYNFILHVFNSDLRPYSLSCNYSISFSYNSLFALLMIVPSAPFSTFVLFLSFSR